MPKPQARVEGKRKLLFNGYKFVLQDENVLLINNANILNTTELYT